MKHFAKNCVIIKMPSRDISVRSCSLKRSFPPLKNTERHVEINLDCQSCRPATDNCSTTWQKEPRKKKKINITLSPSSRSSDNWPDSQCRRRHLHRGREYWCWDVSQQQFHCRHMYQHDRSNCTLPNNQQPLNSKLKATETNLQCTANPIS